MYINAFTYQYEGIIAVSHAQRWKYERVRGAHQKPTQEYGVNKFFCVLCVL